MTEFSACQPCVPLTETPDLEVLTGAWRRGDVAGGFPGGDDPDDPDDPDVLVLCHGDIITHDGSMHGISWYNIYIYV